MLLMTSTEGMCEAINTNKQNTLLKLFITPVATFFMLQQEFIVDVRISVLSARHHVNITHRFLFKNIIKCVHAFLTFTVRRIWIQI